MEGAKPQQIRLGKTRLAIWKNQTENDPRSTWFNWKIEKRYEKNGKWETSHSFRDADAPVVILMLIVATLRMVKELISVQNIRD